MIYLVTGVPGAGKTVESIELALGLRDEAKKKTGVDRPLYVSNVRGFKYDKANALPLEHVRDWQDLPDGSIVLVDEVQDQIPQRGKESKPPEWVQELAKHRHRGFDFVLVTQHASNMDVFVRRQVGEHRHIRRKPRALSFMTGFRQGALRIKWDRFEPRPDEFLAQRNAVKSGAVYNKKIFELYESTTLDTHKPKVPWQIAGIVCLLCFSGFLFYKGISRFVHAEPTDPAALDVAAAESGASPPAAAGAPMYSGFDRVKALEPRVPGLLWSAPAYDHLQVQSYPKLYCWIGQKGCRCMTEQATKVSVDARFCRSVVEDGLYDPYKESPGGSGRGAGGTPAGNASLPSLTPAERS